MTVSWCIKNETVIKSSFVIFLKTNYSSESVLQHHLQVTVDAQL